MKLSLSWIFDHIQASWKEFDIPALLDALNKKVVEVDDLEYRSVDLDKFTLGIVKEICEKNATLYSRELNKSILLQQRDDIRSGQVYLLYQGEKEWCWAEGQDFESSKEGLLPAISINDDQIAGEWKDSFESEDYILTIDNVSITHRPDLWGHRGFAREVAALLGRSLIPLHDLVSSSPVKAYDRSSSPTPDADFALKIEDQEACRRLAGTYVPNIEYEHSWLWMLHRLLRVDSRPINAIVDTTNYVMFDLSQPLHAFDADKLSNRQLIAKKARSGESLLLLDDQEVELTSENLIISDGVKPLALAGVMGGKECGVSSSTKTLLLEAASFDPKSIRKTAADFKIRTEASTRFEKNLDPNQNTEGLLRFLQIMSDNAMLFINPELIVSLGHEIKPNEIRVSHEYIEKKLGIQISSDFIHKALSRLQFHVDIEKTDPIVYKVVVPTFRGMKGIISPEDIIEEVGRSYGFEKIPHILPEIQMRPSDLTPIIRKERIKQYLAFGASMHEVRNYAIFDEAFLKQINWQPEKDTVEIINPVSENMYRMVTTLMPNILKNVETNSASHNSINLFELNTIFERQNDFSHEKKSLAGIFFEAKQQIDFYEKKHQLDVLFTELKLEISWTRAGKGMEPWYHPYKAAYLMHNFEWIGVAGVMNPAFLSKISAGQAFIFEIDAQFLLHDQGETEQYVPLSKYQDTRADVSMITPSTVTAAKIKQIVEQSDRRIFNVELVDFFEKSEWKDQRALTVRYRARAHDKTLTNDEIEDINNKVIENLKKIGAIIR